MPDMEDAPASCSLISDIITDNKCFIVALHLLRSVAFGGAPFAGHARTVHGLANCRLAKNGAPVFATALLTGSLSLPLPMLAVFFLLYW